MKIVNITLDARIAGPQIRIAETAKQLKENFDIDTVVVFPKKYSENYRGLLDNYGLKFHTLSLHKLTRNIFRIPGWFFSFIPETLGIKRIIKRENPDIIHCNGCWQWKGVIAGKLSGKKVIWHLNDSKMDLIIKTVFYLLSKMVDGYIFSGERVKSYYGKFLKKDVLSALIEAPVDVHKFDPKKTTAAEKEENKIRIITVANINRIKGLEYFIETAYILGREYHNLEFYIAGIKLDTKRKYYERLLADIEAFNLKNIFFLGFREDIPSLLKSADIYICSSIAEAGPMTVLEAMAMENAIVSTDVGLVSTYLKDGETGFVVPVKDPVSMAEKIKIFIENPDLRESFGKKARQTVQKELDISITAGKHKAFYEKVTART